MVAAKRETTKFAIGQTATQKRCEYVPDISPVSGGGPFSTTLITPMMTTRWRELRVGDVVTLLRQPATQKAAAALSVAGSRFDNVHERSQLAGLVVLRAPDVVKSSP